jgi:hypothetical protein
VLIATIENAPDIGVKRFFPVLVAALVNGVQANDAGIVYYDIYLTVIRYDLRDKCLVGFSIGNVQCIGCHTLFVPVTGWQFHRVLIASDPPGPVGRR